MQIGDFFAQGGGKQVFDQLVAALTLKQFASDQGVHISKRLVDFVSQSGYGLVETLAEECAHEPEGRRASGPAAAGRRPG